MHHQSSSSNILADDNKSKERKVGLVTALFLPACSVWTFFFVVATFLALHISLSCKQFHLFLFAIHFKRNLPRKTIPTCPSDRQKKEKISLPLLVSPAERDQLYRLNSTFYNEPKVSMSIVSPKTPSAMKSNVYLHAEKRNYIYAVEFWLQRATSRTRLTSLTWEPARSSRTGMRSSSSLSWASENQLLIGTACWGWKI